MTSKRNKARSARDTNRKFKKKANPLKIEKVDYIDYKDSRMLGQFVPERGKILPMRTSGVCAPHQRRLMRAIKQARNIALLPFATES